MKLSAAFLFAALSGAVWPQLRQPPALPESAAATTNFDGNALPKDWRLMNPVEDHWTMQPKRKSLMIISQKTAGCVNGKDGKNLLVLDRPLPPGDFEAIARVSSDFQTHGTQLALGLWSDDANYFWVTFQGDSNYGTLVRRSYFQKISQGQAVGSFQQDVGNSNELYLRIAREGNEYSGFLAAVDPAKPFEAGKIPWSKLGTIPAIRFTGKLAVCAHNFEDGAPEAGAELYSVTVRPQ
jgi:hypothetical protein